MTDFDNLLVGAIVAVVGLFITAVLSGSQGAASKKGKMVKWIVALFIAIILLTFIAYLAYKLCWESTILQIPPTQETIPIPATTPIQEMEMPSEALTEFSPKTDEAMQNSYLDLSVGEILNFGHYEQDNLSSTRQELIEWVVLTVDDRKALLLSTYALDCQPYNSTDTGCTWATSSLRKWLNGSFYNAAFTQEEKAAILETCIPAHKNPAFSTNPGTDTNDMVFLLSTDEVEQFLSSDSCKRCIPTSYTVSRGAYVNQAYGTCWWWLRTPGESTSDACSVNSDGSVDIDDGSVNSNKGCVRPAIWVSIDYLS